MEALSAAEKLILRFESNSFSSISDAHVHALFDGSHPAQAERYIRAVDEVRRRNSSGRALQLAMAKLEEEFRNILVTRVPDLESEVLSSDLRSLSLSDSVDDGDSIIGVSSRRRGSGEYEPGEDPPEEEADAEAEAEAEAEEEIERTETADRGISLRSTSSLVEVDLVPLDVLDDLRMIARQMIAAGYGEECFQAYGSIRKQAIEYCLKQLHVETVSSRQISSLPWDVIGGKIRRWIYSANVCVRLIFASERRLCDLVFDELNDAGTSDGSSSSSDIAFAESVKAAAFQVLSFAEAVSLGEEKAPDRLFKTLDLYEALDRLMPDIEALFDLNSSVHRQAAEILSQLAESVQGMFSELATAIRSDSSKAPVPGGTVHPMTRLVMNYMVLISDYTQTLSDLIVSFPSSAGEENRQQSPLSCHVQHLIATLVANLEEKARLYPEKASSHVFVMNNLHYIVQKVMANPEVRNLVGSDYPKRLRGKYQQAATMYLREAWANTLSFFREEGLHENGSLSTRVLRERFKAFNAAFDEAHRTQSGWIVRDEQLQEELRISISERILPAYRYFLGRYRQHIESRRHSEMYIKYTVDELEKAIGDFFKGSPTPQPSRTRRRSSSLRLWNR